MKIGRFLNRIVSIKLYKLYRVELNDITERAIPPFENKKFTTHFISIDEIDNNLIIDTNLIENWGKVLEYHKTDYNSILILTDQHELAYHFFYTKHGIETILAGEFLLHLRPDEVYLSAERSFPKFQRKGLSVWAKNELFNFLVTEGFSKAYILVENRKHIPNHLYKKLGIAVFRQLITIYFFRRRIFISQV